MNIVRNGAIHRVQTGKPGPPGPAGDVSVIDSGVVELSFSSGDLISILPIKTFDSNQYKVHKIYLNVASIFNNDVSFSIGTDGNPSLLTDTFFSDSHVRDLYILDTDKNLSSLTIKLFPYYISLPTIGSAVVSIFYQEVR